jgi:hypothetical protein
MIRPAFHIDHDPPGDDDYLHSLLLMEINHHGFSYLILHQGRNEVLDAKCFTLPGTDGKNLSDRYKAIIESDAILQQQFREAAVLYNFPDALLVPAPMFNLETSRHLVELSYGTVAKGLILSEKIHGYPAHDVYRVAPDVHSLFQQKFNAGKYWHIYSLWLASLEKFPVPKEAGQPQVHVLFYPDKMLVAVITDQGLQLVQSYLYQVAEDVVYYLLSICNQLALSPEELQLVISGYAQEDSALLTELKKYFLHCWLDEVPENFSAEVFRPLPTHFFSPLLKMALCV